MHGQWPWLECLIMPLPPGSISSAFENLDAPNIEAMGELSNEFRQYHYLSGLVLSELATVLDGRCVPE